MGSKINMIGLKFGKLTVIEECKERTKNGNIVYKCKCDCGNYVDVIGANLRRMNTRSCGCIHSNFKHGKYKSRLYKIYGNMKRRCYNKNAREYKYYGKRGISICDTWLNDFMAFYDWAINNGYNDTLTIDRIDVDGDYEPNNCRWITQHEQLYNTRRNVYLTYNGKTQTITEWAEELGENRDKLLTRYHRGWIVKDILFGRKKPIKKIYKYNYITNEVLDVYDSIKLASEKNNISYVTIYDQLKKQKLYLDFMGGFYFGYSPKETVKIYCYDNESLNLLGVYSSVKNASKKTGVLENVISYQCKLKTKLNNRIKGSTGLFFEKKV